MQDRMDMLSWLTICLVLNNRSVRGFMIIKKLILLSLFCSISCFAMRQASGSVPNPYLIHVKFEHKGDTSCIDRARTYLERDLSKNDDIYKSVLLCCWDQQKTLRFSKISQKIESFLKQERELIINRNFKDLKKTIITLFCVMEYWWRSYHEPLSKEAFVKEAFSKITFGYGSHYRVLVTQWQHWNGDLNTSDEYWNSIILQRIFDVAQRTSVVAITAKFIKACGDNAAIMREFTPYGLTPLHYACLYGKANIVEWLLEHGANANAKADKDVTPLHCAMGKCYFRGSDVPFIVPLSPLYTISMQWLADRKKIVDLLTDKKVEVNARDANNQTAYHYVSDQGVSALALYLKRFM